jgi:predicted nucleic acid-binding protein
LDTNVISELQKSNCQENVKKFAEEISGDDIYISVITLGELCYGVEKLPAGKKKHELSIWLYTKVEEWFYNRIIELDTDVLMEWGKIRANAARTLPVVDTMIAACAITHHMFLVTRNTKDFEDIEGINLLNPWEF